MACLPTITKPRRFALDQRFQQLGDRQRLEFFLGLHQDAAIGAHGERRADGFLAALDPMETAMTSSAVPASLRRRASSTPISSKGFMDILTLLVSTPLPSAFTRTLTL